MLPAEPGADPLAVTIRTNLTRADLKRFNAHSRHPAPTTLEQNQALYGPHMIVWNYAGEPVEAGPDQFDLLPVPVAWWHRA